MGQENLHFGFIPVLKKKMQKEKKIRTTMQCYIYIRVQYNTSVTDIKKNPFGFDVPEKATNLT